MRNIVRPKSLSVLTAFIIGLLFIGTALAHHGWANYDETKTLNMTGVIRESGYNNPHGFVKLQVEGKVWYVVLAPPARMQGRGLTREMLKEGTTATVVGYPHRKTADEMRAERITINGKTTELR
jgi:hypothetical protein